MNHLVDRRVALRALGAFALAPLLGHAAATVLPGDSVYQLRATLTDQDGRTLEWSTLRGSPVLASMFYSSCEMVCPLIFETLHVTLKALPVGERASVKLLLVSFDPERDTVERLKKMARDHACDSQWTLARADDAMARKIAAALGIQYRRLASGEFNHSSVIELLDRDGRIAARSGQLGTADPALVAPLHKLIAAHG